LVRFFSQKGDRKTEREKRRSLKKERRKTERKRRGCNERRKGIMEGIMEGGLGRGFLPRNLEGEDEKEGFSDLVVSPWSWFPWNL